MCILGTQDIGFGIFYVNIIIESFELEGNLEVCLDQLPCSEQGLLQLDQGAQHSVQPDLERLQGQDIYYISGPPVPAPHHPIKKKKNHNFFLISNLSLPPFSLKPFPLILSQQSLLKSLFPSFLSTLFRY